MVQNTKNKSPDGEDFTAFAQIPVWLLRAGKDISHGAVRLYAVIKTYTKNGHNTAFPSQKRLADDMGVSVRQVRTYTRQLYECGGVNVDLRQNDDGSVGRNYVYTLAWDRPFPRNDDEQRKKTSSIKNEIPEESFRSPGEIPEENFRSIAEGNFPSTPEGNFRLTTLTEHTPNKTKNNPLGEVPLSGTDADFSGDQDKKNYEEYQRALEQAKDDAFKALGRQRKAS